MTDKPIKIIFDCSTGVETIVELTDEEIEQMEIDRANFISEETERIAREEAAQAAKESAQAKLTALGLTAEEIAALSK